MTLRRIRMAEYDNKGQVALWKGKSDNEKAPALKGTAIAHRDIKQGETVDISLWKNETDNPNAPVLKGKMADKYVKAKQTDDVAF